MMKLFSGQLSGFSFIVFGLIAGLAIDSTMHFRTRVNGVDVETLRPDELVAALHKPSAAVSTETIINLWGIGQFAIQGSWIAWVPLIVFPILFLILRRRIRRRQLKYKGLVT